MSLLQVVAPLITAAMLALVATRRRLIRRFIEAGAVSANQALAPPDDLRLARFWQPRLRRAGVLHTTPAGREWLDEAAWARYRDARRRRALAVVVVLLVALLVWFTAGRPARV